MISKEELLKHGAEHAKHVVKSNEFNENNAELLEYAANAGFEECLDMLWPVVEASRSEITILENIGMNGSVAALKRPLTTLEKELSK